MKQIKYILFVVSVASALFSISCTDVIDLKLPPKADRIVFNANIMLSGNAEMDSTQVFYINYVSDIKDSFPTPVVGAVVTVSDDLNNVFTFTEEQLGRYVCRNFFHTTSNNYTMKVNYKNEDYIASEVLLPSPPIDSALIQSRSDESKMKATEINVYMTDIPNESNTYEISYTVNHEVDSPSRSWFVFDDRYKDGKVIAVTTIIDEKDAIPGDTINYILNSISTTNYHFLVTLASQSYQASPFAPAPASIRGNVVNTTHADHYPLGYFRINNMSFLDVIYPIKHE